MDLIDVWDIGTFDGDLLSELRANADLVRNYAAADAENFGSCETPGLRARYQTNPHAEHYLHFLESLCRFIKGRTIRSWHYTRLTDSEVEALRATGVQLSTLETTRQRIDAQVIAGLIPHEIADSLYQASPLHASDQAEARTNKFWMTSHPVDVNDDGVAPLLSNWGGEVVYFWIQDAHLQQLVASIGTARVLEIAVRLEATRHTYSAAKAIAGTFSRSLNRVSDFDEFDLCAVRPLAPEAILGVHTEGEATFDRIARGYPTNYRASV